MEIVPGDEHSIRKTFDIEKTLQKPIRNALRSFGASIENLSKIDPHGFRRAFGDANELQELSGIIRARLERLGTLVKLAGVAKRSSRPIHIDF